MSERRLVLVVAAVQFVNVLDFVMVMPLGPDFAAALGIPMSRIGVVGGAYTFAAAISGVIASLFLDRFDRRKALGVTMLGLVVATAAGGLATGMGTLLAARVVAGVFGGPATSIAIAAVSDVVPRERRGRAMGTVMAAFSVASVLGVPAGLELARLYSWRFPFLALAALGLLVTGIAVIILPSLTGHIRAQDVERAERRDVEAPRSRDASRGLPLPTPAEAMVSIIPKARSWVDGLTLMSLASAFALTLGVFLVVPNIAAFFQYNLGYPRERLGLLYLVGGAVSFVTLRAVGSLVDRFGATRFIVLGTVLHVLALWVGFIQPEFGLPAMLIFVLFMLSGSVRMVPNTSLATRVPRPEHRAGFMSAQSAVRHMGSALGAMLGAFVLITEPGGRLERMEWVAGLAVVMAVIVPVLTARIETGVLQREREA